jgi:hypothetical protein
MMDFRSKRVDIAPIMRSVGDVVQRIARGDLPRPVVPVSAARCQVRRAPSYVAGQTAERGVAYTTADVARHLGAMRGGKPLVCVQIALDLLALQEQEVVTSAVLERLARGLTINALQQLVRTLKATQRECEEIEAEQKL